MGQAVQSMAINKTAIGRIVLGMLALAVIILGWAWIDGGREPLRPIVQTIEPPASLSENA